MICEMISSEVNNVRFVCDKCGGNFTFDAAPTITYDEIKKILKKEYKCKFVVSADGISMDLCNTCKK